MKLRNLIFLIFSICVCCLNAEPRTFEGQIVGKDGDRLKISIDGDWAPAVGDPVKVTAIIMGREMNGGSAEVVEVSEDAIWAKITGGNPNVKMLVSISSKNPLPLKIDADALFEMAYDDFLKAFREGDKPGDEWPRIDKKSPEWVRSAPLIVQAAEKGHARAKYLVSAFYLKEFNENNVQERLALLEDAANAGIAEAMYELSIIYYIGQHSIKADKAKRDEWMKKAADAGMTLAAYKFYEFLPWDQSDLKNKYLDIAARGGHPRAQYSKGMGYLRKPEDYEKGTFSMQIGMDWLKKAAEQGYATAAVELGDLHYNGGGYHPMHDETLQIFKNKGEDISKTERIWQRLKIPRNDREAIKYYQIATESDGGLVDPFARIAMLYSDRSSELYDPKKAFEWYHKGAEKDETDSMIELGYCYARGFGVGKSPEKAYEWISKAYDKAPAYDDSIVAMGYCLLYGVGCEKNYPRAKELFESVVKDEYRRHGIALIHLGDMYRRGLGVPKDLYQSTVYYNWGEKIKASAIFGQKQEYYKSIAFTRNARRLLIGEGMKENNPLGAAWKCQDAYRFNPYNAEAKRYHALALMDKSWGKLAKKNNYHESAVQFLKEAANLGDYLSYYYLGEAHLNGMGVKKDKATAMHYYQLAADRGVNAAIKKLDKLR